MKNRRFSAGVVIVLLGLFSAPHAAWAQTAANSGQIVGHAVDASGAAIVGAEIVARSVDTNAVRRTTSDAAGRYAVSGLPLGAYEVKAAAPGFESAAEQAVVTLGGTARRARRS
jgi:hypothetical protein